MRGVKFILAIFVLSLVISGCTTFGPIVTNISSDGQGNLIVEKSMLELNNFSGNMTATNTTTSTIKVVPVAK